MRPSDVWRGLDWSDWPEILATGLLAIGVVIAICGDYRAAAFVAGPGAIAALIAVYRARP